MRLGKNRLRRIIKEEFLSLLREQEEAGEVEIQGGPPAMPEDLWELEEWSGGSPEDYDPWRMFKIESYKSFPANTFSYAARRVARLTGADNVTFAWMIGVYDGKIVWADATVDGEPASENVTEGVEKEMLRVVNRAAGDQPDGIYRLKVNLITA